MVYLSKKQLHNQDDPMDLSALLDPRLIHAAREIYNTYYEVHPDRVEHPRPIGVAIDRHSYRGQLIFGNKPVLLPRECFVPLTQIQSTGY
ncbi:MAG: hypothetical protein SAJ12_19860 [Jaaginema sp. PMC 1079.18]|nr:hypothetical protein [Jaaginema sp. PMC 1080.18]MEC4853243.1 hypothetical protein [Jaaginema sp. PMC 1079.18]MEC4866517.1 hypothetical protein [Jaaginema sp. PMC 1078.18]